jgi:hypothetical protein
MKEEKKIIEFKFLKKNLHKIGNKSTQRITTTRSVKTTIKCIRTKKGI